MSKTGSISYFLIISIIIVISIFIYSIRKTSDQPFQKTSDFTRIDQFIESCLRETSISSIRKQGLDGSSSAFYLKHQIKQDIPYCLSNFTQFEDEGFRVIISPELDVNVTITDESISVKLYHPVNFEKDSNYTFYEAAFEMPRTSVIKLDPSKELSLISPDGSFILQIPKGTSASKNGEKINEIGIKLNDKNFNDLSNDPIASQLSFEGIPHGTVFSKPITIQMFYQEQDIPITVREDELNLGFFDDKGIWIAVPTTIDTKSNKIIAEIKHFTPLSVVMNCDDGDKNSFKFETPNLLLQRCNPCETDGTSPFWFRPITDDEKKYGFDIFAREDYGNILMSEEIPFSPCDENDECLVTICENKQVIDSEGNSLNLWGYNKIEDLEGERVYKLQFEGGGDSCIKASSIDELDNIDVFFEKEDYEDWPDDESFLTEHDLIISPIGCSNDDECKITPSRPLWEFDDKKNPVLSFSYNIKNKDIDNAADACIHGRAIAVYNGVGISDSYIECEIEGTYDYILFSEEGKSCSQCKNQDGKKIWVPAEDSFCNNEDFCVSTIEGAAKLIISGDGDSISEKKCQICQHGKWTDTELATCGSCDLSVMGDSFDSKEIRCFMEAECNDPAKQAILEKAISLHGIDPSMCGMKKGEERIKCLEGSTSTGQFLSAMTKDLDEKSMEDLLFVLARRNKEDSSTIGSIRSKIYEKLNKEPIPCLISPEWFFGNPDDLRVEYRELAFDQAKHIFFYVSSGYYSETAEIEFLNSFHEFNQDFFKDPENYFKLLEYGLSSLRLNTQIDDPLTDFFESQLADEEALRDFQAGQIGILIGYSLKNGIDMNTAFSQRISFYDKKTDRISQIQSEHYHALYELYLNENNPLFYETVTFDNLDEIIDYSVTNPD